MSLSFWLSLVAAAAQSVVLFWERTWPPDTKTTILGFGAIAALGVTILQGKPEWDYAYMVPAFSDGKQVTFFFRATADLRNVSFDCYTRDRSMVCAYEEYHIREGGNSVPRIALSQGDWIADIDATGAYGKMREEIKIEDVDGRATTTFLRVIRKDAPARGNGPPAIICQNPSVRFIPACF